MMSIKKGFLKVNNRQIACVFRKSKRAKYMRLEISPSGELLAVYPKWMSFKMIKDFLDSKIDWVIENVDLVQKRKYNVFHDYSNEKYLKHKKEALALAKSRANYFSMRYGFKFNKVSIRNQKTRWGSCSSRRDISFNYKILFLPEKIADYIIVHELCHLKEMNHSHRFWKLVSKEIPDYKDAIKTLKSI